MGNSCVGSSKTATSTCSDSLWWSKKKKEAPQKVETESNINTTKNVEHKAPQMMKIEKEEIKATQQKEPISHTEEASSHAAQAKPAVPKKPHNVIRQASAGLKTESVLLKKTGNLRDFYNLGRRLGKGQFGTTFLCVEKATGKEYACKSIVKRKLITEEDVEDVRREIQIMHHLVGSPDVITIKEAYEDAVSVHVVMELCAGGELFDRIVERGHYTERKAAKLARTIVGVIESCHSLGVMHRDLKPENFLFINQQEDSPLKAIDFGLSAFFKPGEIFNDVVGSPYYVAPEVLRKRYGPEADVWSAGVIIYILLCGVPPFWGESEQEIFEAILHSEADFTSDPWHTISGSAKDLADVDNSGTIGYGEFIAATLHLNKIEREDHLVAAFSYFDKDGSGYITQDELQQACEEFGIKDVRLEEMIREADQDNVSLNST
ncbi:unnamed protein product [Lupinus luteus]|uniref:non-specific serine/threonine protein kinase n=1 Tax=Lupinus luteus TaxID=3873 RepID=A0AAV1X5R7_LUPLU